MKLKYLFVLCLFISHLLVGQAPVEKPNILFIVVDDLNDYIEALEGNAQVKTPNINRIAELGTVFTNAFCSSPLCCPSRTTFLTGKAAEYTKIYSSAGYKCGDFSKIFTPANNNDEYFTIPGYLKDSAGYFTYSLNKIFHCYENYQEYDDSTPNPCNKSLSWNKIFVYNDTSVLSPGVTIDEEGLNGSEWAAINDTLETYMMDYIAVDSTIKFIHNVAQNDDIICNKPFFIALGIKKPHKPLYIPEKYFSDDYIKDYYALPFDIAYNNPKNAFPANGVLMAPQPEVPFSDYYALPTDGLAQQMVAGADNDFEVWANTLDPLPVIDITLTDEQRIDILAWSKRANLTIAYMAAINYIDTQIGKLLDSLENYPEIYHNTVIVFIGDNGFSLSEKKHWGKRALWETDERVPLIIADLREPVAQVCNRTTNLLDLFPTFCDIAEVAHPEFSDGSDYLDGQSLIPLLNNTTMSWVCPVLSSIKKEYGTEGFCFPQYSVRDERFHYLRYQSNGGTGIVCNEAASFFEEEFYEIGANRETDPYEWNNLINDEDYAPVINYLKEFLPTGSLYLQKAFEVRLSTKPLPCLLNNHVAFKINTTLYNENGNYILGAALTNYQFKWTNNLTADIFYGKSYTFNTASIPAATFAANDKILFYVEVTDITSGQLVAFNTKTMYINNTSSPVIDFSLSSGLGLLSVDINDYSLTGTYANSYWTFGDGSTSQEYLPDTHYYAASGTYSIRNYVQYGNGCTKSKAHNIVVSREAPPEASFTIYPNPASNLIYINFNAKIETGSLQVFNILGQTVLSQNIVPETKQLTLNVTALPGGNYIVKIDSPEFTSEKLIEIIR